MAKFHRVEENGKGDWSDWQQPVPDGYKMACCDCGLVHDMQFRVHKGKVQMRAKRNRRSTAQMRRHAGIKINVE